MNVAILPLYFSNLIYFIYLEKGVSSEFSFVIGGFDVVMFYMCFC